VNAVRREIELKLEMNAAALGQIRRWLVAENVGENLSTQTLKTIYFDTSAADLYRAGVSWRIRGSSAGYVQNIKLLEGCRAGLFDRTEWECATKGFRPDLVFARKTTLKIFQQKNLARSIHAAFEVHVVREKCVVSNDDSQLALALDRGRVVAGKRAASFCELEIEIAEGKIESLFDLARSLQKITPLRPSFRTKADRGFELLSGSQNGVHRARDVSLGPKITSEEAFRIIARDCLRLLRANEAATLKGKAEALHQMRIALRRLRASISAFSRMVSDPECERLKTEFKWLMGQLGTARDLDVLLSETLAHALVGSGAKGLPAIRKAAQTRRRQAYRQVARVLRSPRLSKLLMDGVAWIECGRWRKKRSAPAMAQRGQAVVTHATEELHNRYRKFSKHLADFRKINPAARHALRIRAKKLRYAVEFFGNLFPGKKHARDHTKLLDALKDLQEALGSLNDIATHEKFMSALALSSRADSSVGGAEAFAAGVIYNSEDTRIIYFLDAANAAARKIRDAKPFWK